MVHSMVRSCQSHWLWCFYRPSAHAISSWPRGPPKLLHRSYRGRSLWSSLASAESPDTALWCDAPVATDNVAVCVLMQVDPSDSSINYELLKLNINFSICLSIYLYPSMPAYGVLSIFARSNVAISIVVRRLGKVWPDSYWTCAWLFLKNRSCSDLWVALSNRCPDLVFEGKLNELFPCLPSLAVGAAATSWVLKSLIRCCLRVAAWLRGMVSLQPLLLWHSEDDWDLNLNERIILCLHWLL